MVEGCSSPSHFPIVNIWGFRENMKEGKIAEKKLGKNRCQPRQQIRHWQQCMKLFPYRALETRQQEARSQQAEPQARAHCPVVEVRPSDLW